MSKWFKKLQKTHSNKHLDSVDIIERKENNSPEIITFYLISDLLCHGSNRHARGDNATTVNVHAGKTYCVLNASYRVLFQFLNLSQSAVVLH